MTSFLAQQPSYLCSPHNFGDRPQVSPTHHEPTSGPDSDNNRYTLLVGWQHTLFLQSFMARISPDTSDHELIRELKAGNQVALTVLYDRYGGLVYTVALNILKQPTDAEDLTQEIFVTFWKQDKFDPDRSALSTYLGILTRSRALNRLSSHSSRQRSLERLQGLFFSRSSSTPLENASLSERKEILQRALAQLSDQQRQILDMNFYQGLSHSEISQQLNVPLGTVKTKARRSLIQLREQLGEAVL
ncbi:MAG: sigma-70 family RNA polymerase sigma factor [Cyanobacteria bacterium J06597_1]